MIVRDPGGVLRRDLVGNRQLLPMASSPSAVVFPSDAGWFQSLAFKLSTAPHFSSQPSASTAETAAPVPPGRSENIAGFPDTTGAASVSLASSQASGAAPSAPVATPAGADFDDNLQITQGPVPRKTTTSY